RGVELRELLGLDERARGARPFDGLLHVERSALHDDAASAGAARRGPSEPSWRKHRTRTGPAWRRSGSTVRQRAIASGQAGAQRQPIGIARRSGAAPSIVGRRRAPLPRAGAASGGTLRTRARVYGWRGDARTSPAAPDSTTWPA